VEDLGDRSQEEMGSAFGKVLDRDLFLFLLDLEVKRARRYQNFLCLMLIKVKNFSKDENGGGLEACYKILGNLLIEETRESDIIGFMGIDSWGVILPYADAKTGEHLKFRFEDALNYYDFKTKGIKIMIDQVCFPVHGTDTEDLIRRTIESEEVTR
jgi:GGDEF domain-containing protein